MRHRPELAAGTASAVVLTGVQGIVPALPDLQRALGLDDAQISLIMLVYVLAGAIAAVPAGALADRVGARPVLVGSLGLYGLMSIVCAVVPELWVLLVARSVLGACFGAVLSLSGSVLADTVSRSRQPVAQSRRVMVMTSTEALLPLLAGMLVVVAGWQSALLLGALAIPAAVLCWLCLPPISSVAREQGTAPLHQAFRAAIHPDGLGVQASGFARFLFKFTALSYLPILADRAGLGPADIGLAFSVGAGLGIAAAALAPWLIRRCGTAVMLASAIVIAGAPFLAAPAVAEGATHAAAVVVLIVLVTSIGDALLGVATNVISAAAAPPGARGAYIGITSTVRNAGKVTAPAVVGMLVLTLSLPLAIAIVGALGLFAITGVPGAMRAANAHPDE